MPIDDSYNPSIHRINHAVKSRAIHPERPIPETPSILLRFASPPDDLIEKVQSKIDALIGTAEVKKGEFLPPSRITEADQDEVPPKAKGKRVRDTVKPISGLDVDALLGEGEKSDIDPDNAVPGFKQALAATEELSEIEDATKQMGNITNTLITESFGDSKYARALECLAVMREELINLEEPGLYNTYVRDMKKQLLSGALGGDRRDFWFKIRWTRMGLIDKKQSEVSVVTPEEAEEVSTQFFLAVNYRHANTHAVLQVEVMGECTMACISTILFVAWSVPRWSGSHPSSCCFTKAPLANAT